MAWVRQHIHQIVVTLHLRMRHAAGEHDLVGQPHTGGLGLQRGIRRTPTDQQQARIWMLCQDGGQRVEQQIQTFIGVKRADEPNHPRIGQAEPGLEREVRLAAGFERVDIDRVGYHRHAGCSNAARNDVAAQPFADGEYVVGAAQRPGLERAGKAVAHTAFGSAAVVHGGIFPKGPHLIHHRDTQPRTHPQSRPGVEYRRVRVQDGRAQLFGYLLQAALKLAHQRKLAHSRQAARGGCRCTVKLPAIDLFFQRLGAAVFRAGEVEGFPAAPALLAQQRQGTKGVPAVQRNRVVEDVQDPQAHWCTFVQRTAVLRAWGAARRLI